MLFQKFVLFVLAPLATKALTYNGVDWSSTLMLEKQGKTYKTTSGSTAAFETILKSSGVNTVRQRLWVNPRDGNYNLDYNLALGKRAVAAGLEVYLDLHYSDTWADPSHQVIPNGWPTDIDNLAWKVYNYTLATCNSFQSAGIPLSIISIGNEIASGMLEPVGSASKPANLARLLHSASAGIKDSTLSQQPKIMVHTHSGYNWPLQSNFYNLILGQGTFLKSDFDMIGLSYYPFSSINATLSALKSSMNNLANTYKKQIVVAEVDWPVSCSQASASPSDLASIPKSAAGQATLIKDVAAAVSDTSGSLGVGIFYWEPGWVGNANLGSKCTDELMVESSGQARSSLSVFSSI